jgi:hypothetical protein
MPQMIHDRPFPVASAPEVDDALPVLQNTHIESDMRASFRTSRGTQENDMRFIIALVMLATAAALSGCSFAKSSESISDSISSPSKSSSDSSDSGGDSGEPEAPQDAASYEADVVQLAGTYAKTGGDIGAFRTAVSKLATERGISNWETDPTTCQAIGRGVGSAGMGAEAFQKFSKDLFADDLTKANELQKGYESAVSTPAPGGA